MRYQDLHDADIINRLYFQYEAGSTVTDANMETWLQGVVDAYTTANIAQYKTSEETLVEVIGIDLSSATSAVGTYAASKAGTNSSPPLGGSICYLINYQISRRYRGGHPRTYLSGPTTEFQQDADTVAPATVTALQSAWTTFLNAVEVLPVGSSTGSTHVNVSYYGTGTAVLAETGRYRTRSAMRELPVVDIINSCTVSSIWGSQRRRLGR
jgi:hypothetical protein